MSILYFVHVFCLDYELSDREPERRRHVCIFRRAVDQRSRGGWISYVT